MKNTKGNEFDCYPRIHFAPKYGWINDPNGLVYHDGIFELYYQANPGGVEWDDMTWGHARSKDLVHWEELEPVMYPDENGMMFSGCGLRNDREMLGLPKDALLFPYTAALFSEGFTDQHFTIRLAYSIDGGNTLIKKDGTLIRELAEENRDPKVFWHEGSGAFILVLWIEKNDFGIFRSGDMQDFTLSQRITLNGGFECPDLFELPVVNEDGSSSGSKWVFWAADGLYFVGDFDGYQFTPVQDRQYAYFVTKLPYAAQTWSGDPEGRVIQIPWLRTKCVYGKTTGAHGIPRELSLKKVDGKYVLKQSLPEEICSATEQIAELSKGGSEDIPEDGAIIMALDSLENSAVSLYEKDKQAPFLSVSYNVKTGSLGISDGVVTEFMSLGRDLPDRATIIYDRGIIEVTTKDETVVQMTDLAHLRTTICSRVSFDDGSGKLTIKIVR